MANSRDIQGELFEIELNEFGDFIADLWEYRGYVVRIAAAKWAAC